MDKRILVGLLAGIIVGVIEMFAFAGSYELLIIPAVLGALIGFANTKVQSVNFFAVCAAAGALLFIIVAARSGLWLDDIVTGAITGLIIGAVMHFLGKSNLLDKLGN